LRHGLVEVLAEFGHAAVELVDLVLADEPDGGFRVGQRHRLPGGHELMSDVGDGEERRVAGVQELLASGQILAFGSERIGGLGLLLGREGLAHAEPAEGHAHGGHGGAEPLGRGGGRADNRLFTDSSPT
jgi:hypothetical protein